MPLSWNEIKDRARRFSREWADEASEDAEAKSFWDAFFEVFGVPRRRVAAFERRIKKLDGKDGYIDLLWKGVLLIEHKSRGKDLDRAHTQARDYFHGLSDAELPKYLLVSDFARFRLYDLDSGEEPLELPITDQRKHIYRSRFVPATRLARATKRTCLREAAGYWSTLSSPQGKIEVDRSTATPRLAVLNSSNY